MFIIDGDLDLLNMGENNPYECKCPICVEARKWHDDRRSAMEYLVELEAEGASVDEIEATRGELAGLGVHIGQVDRRSPWFRPDA